MIDPLVLFQGPKSEDCIFLNITNEKDSTKFHINLEIAYSPNNFKINRIMNTVKVRFFYQTRISLIK